MNNECERMMETGRGNPQSRNKCSRLAWLLGQRKDRSSSLNPARRNLQLIGYGYVVYTMSYRLIELIYQQYVILRASLKSSASAMRLYVNGDYHKASAAQMQCLPSFLGVPVGATCSLIASKAMPFIFLLRLNHSCFHCVRWATYHFQYRAGVL